MQGFQVFNTSDVQKHFEVIFLLSFTHFNQAKWLSRFWQSVVRECRLVLLPSQIAEGPKILIFVSSGRNEAQIPWSSFLIAQLCLLGYYCSDQVQLCF